MLNAFTSLAGAPFITDEQIGQYFSKNPETKEYMVSTMPIVEGGEANQKNYSEFTTTMFLK